MFIGMVAGGRIMMRWNHILGAAACGALFHVMLAQLFLFSILGDELIDCLHITPLELGGLSSIMLYSLSLSLLPAGFLFDRLPARSLLMVAALLAVVGTVALAAYPSTTTVSFNRLLCGVANGLSFLGGLLLMPQLFPRHPALASGMFLGLGQTGGWLVYGGLLPLKLAWDWQAMLWFLAGLSAVVGVCLLSLPYQAPTKVIQRRQAWSELIATFYTSMRQLNPWLCGLIAGLFSFPDILLAGLYGIPYFTQVWGLSVSQAGQVLSSLVLGLLLGFPLFGWVADHTTQWRRVLCITSLVMASLLMAMACFAMTVWQLYALFITIGVLVGATTLAFTSVQQTNTATAVALATILMNVSGGIGQVLFGAWLPQMTAEHLTRAWWLLPSALLLNACLSWGVEENR